MKLLELNLICIINYRTSKKRTEILTVNFLTNFNLKNSSSAGKKTARFLLVGAGDRLTYFSFDVPTDLTFLTFVALAGNSAELM